MNKPIPTETRDKVKERASEKCEYCLLDEAYSFLPFHIDHVIAIKHGGTHDLSNLAYCCPHCNQYKGSDISTYLPDKKLIIPLFNPRTDLWSDHFHIEDGAISPKTEIGKGTIRLLKFNQAERLMTRKLLFKEGLYP